MKERASRYRDLYEEATLRSATEEDTLEDSSGER